MEKLTGHITRVFGKSDGKRTWASVLIKLEDGKTIKAAGKIAEPSIGRKISIKGEFFTDPVYGEQFKVKDSNYEESYDLSGLTAYLCSSNFRGIGMNTAILITEKFGEDTISVIENAPEKLVDVKGVNEEKARSMQEVYLKTKDELPIYEIFKGQVTEHQVKTILMTYEDKAVSTLKKNPYKLIHDVDGFGFKRVDALAMNMGIKKDDDKRVGAAIEFILTEWTDEGHCYGILDNLMYAVEELTGALSNEKKAKVISDEIDAGFLIYEEGDRIYLKSLYNAEKYLADRCAAMLREGPLKHLTEEELNETYKEIEEKSGFLLEDKQKEAVRVALRNKISVITGGPGTGKTTIVNTILKAWRDESSIRLLAPTGRASRRMSDLTGGYPASTIHRLIGQERQDKGKNYLVIVDEASMLDIELAAKLFRYIENTDSQLVLIGDIDQLPPIGPGNFFRDMVKSPVIPTVWLELSHRQHGLIALNASRINSGIGIGALAKDDTFVHLNCNKENALEGVVNEYLKLAEKYELKDICCITPMKKGNLSKESLTTSTRVVSDVINRIVRDKLNPETEFNKTFQGCPFRLGDRVMQLVNDYKRDIFNGDCGTVIEKNEDEKTIVIEVDDGRIVTANLDQIKDMDLAFSMTVHKAQGSEYKAVVLANLKEHFIMLERNMLYTGVTRAKEKVILIGEPWAINQAIGTVNAVTRNTMLRERIAKALKP